MHVETVEKVRINQERFEEVDRQCTSSGEELKDYIAVRNRCIQLKILNELLNENHKVRPPHFPISVCFHIPFLFSAFLCARGKADSRRPVARSV